VQVTLDTQAPVVVITSPIDGALTRDTSIAVQWTVDGVVQTAQTSQNLVEGMNRIVRGSVDAAGNSGADTVFVRRDTFPPVVQILSPAEGLLTNQTPIAVNWTVDGGLQTTQTTAALVEGANTIMRAATDSAVSRLKSLIHDSSYGRRTPVLTDRRPILFSREGQRPVCLRRRHGKREHRRHHPQGVMSSPRRRVGLRA